MLQNTLMVIIWCFSIIILMHCHTLSANTLKNQSFIFLKSITAKTRRFSPFTIALDTYLRKDQQGAINNQVEENLLQNDNINKGIDKLEVLGNQERFCKKACKFSLLAKQYEKAKKNFFETMTTLKKRSLTMRAVIFSAQMQAQYDYFLKHVTQQARQAKKCLQQNLDSCFEVIIPKKTNLMSMQSLSPFFSRLKNRFLNMLMCYKKIWSKRYSRICFIVHQQHIKQEREEQELELKKHYFTICRLIFHHQYSK
ncbi:unnamed protein product [Paramecium octaurelia]|uniref:Transmembrane protein n=1 Tax=Paramecium octaurelia TaxID=43137 RepID=A0A8S1VYP3_PAROT|nr:unnamed protein product [Paramecium octaurelia]